MTSGDDRLHHLLWECNARLVPMTEAAFENSDLSLPLAGTLDAIAERPGITIAEMARSGPKTQQAISQLVARLERLGYVERRLGPGRGIGLHLTAEGERAAADGRERERAIEAELARQLGRELFESLRTTLARTRTALTTR